MSRPFSRRAITVLMDLLVGVALVLTVGIVVTFFGALSSTELGGRLVAITSAVTLPLGLPVWKTPYAGVIQADSASTVGIVLVVEWLLSNIRRHSA